MPILTATSSPEDWIEPDDVPRTVIAYGIASKAHAVIELDLHIHAKGQVMLVERGALSCEVEGGLWMVPPGSAIWVPGGALHAIRSSGQLVGYNAFIAPTVTAGLPRTCCAISVSPLLRELLTRAAELPLDYEENDANSRLMGVLLDEIAVARVEDLHLPMPVDLRLRTMVETMMATPADRGTLTSWARQVGMSGRTLERAIRNQTGLSFGRWRQQLSVMLAVKWLADGVSIQAVAANLGYESVPSFVTMFRKALGTSPGRYMAERFSGGRRLRN